MRFSDALNQCLVEIPRGCVATCGQIAAALGDVRAARAVATWIVEHPNLPGGHRVVRAEGRPLLTTSIPLLSREGVPLRDGNVPKDCFVPGLTPVPFLTELREEQLRLSSEVSERDEGPPVERIGAVDVAYSDQQACVSAVVCNVGTLDPVEIVELRTRTDFPYIPTYLGYRELPAIEKGMRRITARPDVLLVDGHGRLHPARFGIACFVGVRLGIRTIGVAKHHLAGRPASARRAESDAIPLEINGTVSGYAWLPPHGVTPIYVSVGHRISLDAAMSVVRRATKTRIPEPLRLADQISKRMKRREKD